MQTSDHSWNAREDRGGPGTVDRPIALAAALVQTHHAHAHRFPTTFGCIALIALVAAITATALPGNLTKDRT
jgi:hypothetical protein